MSPPADVPVPAVGSAPPPTAGPLSARYLAVTIATLALVTIVAFESMAVSTAMPAVAADLESVRNYGLAFSAMLTAQLLGIVLAGVWTDRSGPMPGILTGQLLVAGGSALCGAAAHYPVFLLGRATTGLGGGLLVVMLYVIAARLYPEAIRPRLFTLVSAAWVLPSLAGPSIAAWLTHAISWRAVFWVVVPPTLATFAFFLIGQRRVDLTGLVVATSDDDATSHLRIAWWGLALALAAGAIQYGSAAAEDTRGLGAEHAVAVVGLIGVLVAAPRLVPVGTWRMARGIPSVMLARALLSGSFFAGISYVPLMIVSLAGRDVRDAGILIAIGSVGWAIGSWWQGRARVTAGRERLVLGGALLLAAGLGGVGLVTAAELPWWLTAVPIVLCGLGMGVGVTTTTVLALALAAPEDHGPTSSSLQLADVLGSVLGIAAVSAVFATWHDPATDRWLFTAIFLALSAVAAVVVRAAQRIRT